MNFVGESLSPSESMVVQTQKVEEGWQLVEETKDGGEAVVFTGLSDENDCQARLEWHQVAPDYNNNRGKWANSGGWIRGFFFCIRNSSALFCF